VRFDVASASDASLAIAVARCQEDALAEIYRRHAGTLLGLARRILVDQHLSEEVVQEVFLRLWRRPERFDPDRGTLRAFLLAEIHGRSVDLIRSDTARRRRELVDIANSPRTYDLENEIADSTTAARVRRAVEKLPAPERQAVELSYFGGHTYREVAKLLDEPEGTVKGRIRAAMRRLRQELGPLRIDRLETLT
jgi:RNA polymerase sigma-70 factor (ECF subfamily)